MRDDTIVALASGAGLSGIAVLRVSGSRAAEAWRALSGRALSPARHLVRVGLVDPVSGEALDDALAVWFPGPNSFTGEDVTEFHIHGGRAVVAAVIDALQSLPGCRLAEAGEFTRRAFEAGKMDLTAAEGLADLIDSDTQAQRRQALRQLRGDLGAVYDEWRGRLVSAMAHLEATIDFSDEELPPRLAAEVRAEAASVATAIASHLADGRRGERLRGGVQVAIVGPPNAGKSSLLNYLAQRDAAIVSESAGTTRDIIEVRLDLGGYPLVVADTAGLRAGGDPIEREGVRRAERRAGEVDLKVVLFDGSVWPEIDTLSAALVDDNAMAVVNKSDLGRVPDTIEVDGRRALAISIITGAGMDDFLARLTEEVAARCDVAAAPLITRARHREALEDCQVALARFDDTADTGVELAAEDLRLAVRALGRITGRVGVEDVLDVVFRDFCIGK
jgi:tRNA modification GTPase